MPFAEMVVFAFVGFVIFNVLVWIFGKGKMEIIIMLAGFIVLGAWLWACIAGLGRMTDRDIIAFFLGSLAGMGLTLWVLHLADLFSILAVGGIV